MKTVLVCFGLFLLLVSSAFGQKPNPQAELPTKPPEKDYIFPLVPSEQVFFYGVIPPDSWVCHHFVLNNPHEDTVTIVDMIPGCDCTHLPKPPISIAPGESYLLRALFDTRTYFGETNRDIEIVTDFEPSPRMDIFFASLITNNFPVVDIAPPSTVLMPGKDQQLFTITNTHSHNATYTVLIDNDSSLAVSDVTFRLRPGKSKEITASALWGLFDPGFHYRSLVLEIESDITYRITIPVKLNKF